MENRCAGCGRMTTADERGLTRKLINRGTTSYQCLGCLARHFQVTDRDLEERIRHFRAMGCTLFVQDEGE